MSATGKCLSRPRLPMNDELAFSCTGNPGGEEDEEKQEVNHTASQWGFGKNSLQNSSPKSLFQGGPNYSQLRFSYGSGGGLNYVQLRFSYGGGGVRDRLNYSELRSVTVAQIA